jgi:hypothetical protein
MKREFCDKCGAEFKGKCERYTVSISQSDEPFETGFLLSEDVLCRKCTQGYTIDINAMEATGE